MLVKFNYINEFDEKVETDIHLPSYKAIKLQFIHLLKIYKSVKVTVLI